MISKTIKTTFYVLCVQFRAVYNHHMFFFTILNSPVVLNNNSILHQIYDTVYIPSWIYLYVLYTPNI